jgi:hypothetical protein
LRKLPEDTLEPTTVYNQTLPTNGGGNLPKEINEAIGNLRKLFQRQFELQQELEGLTDQTSVAESEEKGSSYLDQIRNTKAMIRDYLEKELLRYPPHHHKNHFEELKAFHEVAPYEKSVFIMTKFPQGRGKKEKALKTLIEEVKAAIRAAGYVPRIATYGYHDWLWQNVELYLVGCCKGIAIVEDRYQKELNPNVALEWGWMKGMGKKVYFLMEEQFAHSRADWQGLISKTFKWESAGEGVRDAIKQWLIEKERG